MTLTLERLRRLPKAELHIHLDGCLRPATMVDLARTAKVELPARTPEALGRWMLVDDARDLEDYLKRFDVTIALLQDPDAIERVAYEMVEDAKADGLRYFEVRYCPTLSTRHGLTVEAVIEAQWRGLQRGERDFGVKARIINCALRQNDPALSVDLARRSVALKHLGVVGFDIAGGEAGRYAKSHAEAFRVAREGYLGVTVHAGEAAGAGSVRQALFDCGADRIGHGTRLYEDPALEAYVRDRRTPIEINLTSNVQTRAVPSAAAHPLRGYLDRDLAVFLNSDSWLMSGTTCSAEYWLAHTALGATPRELSRMMMCSFQAAFLPWAEKQALIQEAMPQQMSFALEGASPGR
ncbi:MAG TPA: adenosine deaminase [Gemmatimonadales bacterium]|nr:adenosine deaminase [Gemmatimonadales bacterium]